MPPSYFEHVIGLDNRAPEYAAPIKYLARVYGSQVEGWCSEEKQDILIDLVCLARPEKVVEIGVWMGKSLFPMAFVLRANLKGKAYAIDPWDPEESARGLLEKENIDFWSRADHDGILARMKEKTIAFSLQDQIVLIRKTSAEAEPIQDIDILHIDGNHSEEASYFDVAKWVPLVKSGGWIVFDGIEWFEQGKFTTQRAVDWLNENCVPFAHFSQWGIWVKP